MEKRITIREFLRNYKKYTKQKDTLIITNHGKEEGVFMPYKKWEKDIGPEDEYFSIETLKQFPINMAKFKSIKKLSQNIDDIYKQ